MVRLGCRTKRTQKGLDEMNIVEQRAADRRGLQGVALNIYWDEINNGAKHSEALAAASSFSNQVKG